MQRWNATDCSRALAAALALGLALACAAPPPPAPAPAPVAPVDLSQIGTLGVLDFTVRGDVSLEPAARRELVTAVQALQPGAALRELGSLAEVLASVHGSRLGPETVGAIGRRHQVDALLVAELEADAIDEHEVKRRLRTADVVVIEGTLDVRIYDARQGVPIWSASAAQRLPLTQVSVSAWGTKRVDTRHLDEVRLALVKDLVAQASADFAPRLAPIAGR